MLNLAGLLFGPLTEPECRRALARGWLILVRGLAAVAMLGVALVIVWWWWVCQQADPAYRPYQELRIGLTAIEAMLLTIGLVLGPAVLAGSFAGEARRGLLGILLTTRVSGYEIVMGRLIGKLSQVGMILLSGVPALVLLGALAGFGQGVMLTMLLVPIALAWGGGGLAVAASVLARRGRDALLSVYLIDLLLLILARVASTGWLGGGFGGLSALNPYEYLGSLVWREEVAGSLVTASLWTLIGLGGLAVGSYQLRPASLKAEAGASRDRRRSRRGRVPPVNEARPMLWKELYIERGARLGGFGHWVGGFLTVSLALGSLGLMTVYLGSLSQASSGRSDWAADQLGEWIGGTSLALSVLIEWAIGLRAAVSIASERERGTWDALLASPLEAREIILGKLWGSVHALRWLILATFLAWALAVIANAFPVVLAVTRGGDVLVIGTFMAAVGVRTSLVCATTTRAMATTIGAWLGAYLAFHVMAAFVLLVGTLACNCAWIVLAWLGLLSPLTTFWVPIRWSVAGPIAYHALYLLATLIIVADTRLRFDRIAGRMTEGTVSLAFEAILHGRPSAPVPIEDGDRVGPASHARPVNGEAHLA